MRVQRTRPYCVLLCKKIHSLVCPPPRTAQLDPQPRPCGFPPDVWYLLLKYLLDWGSCSLLSLHTGWTVGVVGAVGAHLAADARPDHLSRCSSLASLGRSCRRSPCCRPLFPLDLSGVRLLLHLTCSLTSLASLPDASSLTALKVEGLPDHLEPWRAGGFKAWDLHLGA